MDDNNINYSNFSKIEENKEFEEDEEEEDFLKIFRTINNFIGIKHIIIRI